MRSESLRIDVSLPTLDEFAEGRPHHAARARGEGHGLFNLVMKPETYRDMEVLTRLLNLPAVVAVAATAGEIVATELTSTEKQFLGALTCALMEANGHAKTGRKRAIPRDGWSRGEVYTIANP
jgi:hypothetical protein